MNTCDSFWCWDEAVLGGRYCRRHMPTAERPYLEQVEALKDFLGITRVKPGVPPNPATNKIRTFDTGATRDVDTTKPDYEGFLSPLVLARYGEYMHKNRVQPNGSLRDSDNWQKGIPQTAYMKSAFRHFFEWWAVHRRLLFNGLVPAGDVIDDAICGLLFNAMGYLHEHLKQKAFRQAAQGSMAINQIDTRDAKHYRTFDDIGNISSSARV